MPTSEVRIVQISDLHVGRQLNEAIWDAFVTTVTLLRPHLILVTGDLVDTPFRWRLTLAKAKLDTLIQSLNTDTHRVQLVVIPGNHDASISGILPWFDHAPLLSSLGTLLVVSLMTIAVWFFSGQLTLALGFLGLLIIAAGAVLGTITQTFPADVALTGPTEYRVGDILIHLYPFDSATAPSFIAGGNIRASQFAQAKRPLSFKDGETPYRLCIVHHHPLPIPYDDAWEQTMILKNAGAFLNEMSRLGMRLILHGHKHHWHFSSTIINAHRPDQHNLAVLSAETLCRGKRKPSGPCYGFNVLTLDAIGNVLVTPYQSNGGPSRPVRLSIRRTSNNAENGNSTLPLNGITLNVTVWSPPASSQKMVMCKNGSNIAIFGSPKREKRSTVYREQSWEKSRKGTWNVLSRSPSLPIVPGDSISTLTAMSSCDKSVTFASSERSSRKNRRSASIISLMALMPSPCRPNNMSDAMAPAPAHRLNPRRRRHQSSRAENYSNRSDSHEDLRSMASPNSSSKAQRARDSVVSRKSVAAG